MEIPASWHDAGGLGRFTAAIGRCRISDRFFASSPLHLYNEVFLSMIRRGVQDLIRPLYPTEALRLPLKDAEGRSQILEVVGHDVNDATLALQSPTDLHQPRAHR